MSGIKVTDQIVGYDACVAALPEKVIPVLRWAEQEINRHIRYERSRNPEKQRKADLRGVEREVQRRLDQAFSETPMVARTVGNTCREAIRLLSEEIARTLSTETGETKIAILAQLEQVWSWIKERAMARR